MDEGPPHRSLPTLTQELTLWFAGAFLSLGFFGLLPGSTVNLETATVLFGIFHVSLLHNLVHLALGAGALAAAGADQRARVFLVAVSIILMVLVIYGQLDATPWAGQLVPVTNADAWLHTAIAVSMLLIAVTASAPRRRRSREGA